MSATQVLQPPTVEVHPEDKNLVRAENTANAVTMIAAPKSALDSRLERRLLRRYDIHQPSPDSDTKEVHLNGLQPYTITRKSLRPGRPMMTISSLPSGEVVAGTKAGRREFHIFAGNPLRGTTVWLPVVASSDGGAWDFNANDRALRWREVKTLSSENGRPPRVLELVDVITSEILVEYHETNTNTGAGAALHFYADMEEALEPLIMASILAVTEPMCCDRDGNDRGCLLGSASPSPENQSRSPSPMPHPRLFEHENVSGDLTERLADFGRKLRERVGEETDMRV